MRIIYETVVGSKMHGLDTPSSDTDTRFIYIRSLRNIISPFKNKDTLLVERNDLVGDVESWELTKFVLMLTSGNPTCYEVIKSPLFNSELMWSTKIRNSFPLYHCSCAILNAHIGYADAQFKRYINKYIQIEGRTCETDKINDWASLELNHKATKQNFLRRLPKAIVAAHRVAAQGIQLLVNHDFAPVIKNFSPTLAAELMDIKLMKVEDINLSWVTKQADKIEDKIQHLNTVYNLLSDSEKKLQPNISAIEDMLMEIYTEEL